ncbi:TonB-dependent receptor [Amphiplicatus metriothermophilus]|uniref:TonB-dependent receptor n=2 Tax=Amphiplicatus metriothermophilus TaxID=1519374 RepID=A0A239PJV4_9PROT|nr:TonB-dependent receptor [Amphiplicatus metriothermophilus]
MLLGAAGALCTPYAYAQTDASNDRDEIVVIGTKLSRQKAIEEKRDDSRVVDALGIDELGQLPDKNVGESLNRLPGVTMLVEKGEGRFVQIRGVNPGLNNVAINGVSLGSPEQEGGGRGAPLDVISGGVLGGVQVIKTPTPDMDAQGIGGTVNLKTAMPFDRDDAFYGYLTGRYGYEEIRPKDEGFGGHDPYAVDALVAGKLANDTIGWLIGASWSDREYIAQGRYQDDWDESSGIGLPVNVKNNYYVIGRERLNINGAVEFRPDDETQFFVRGFYADWSEFQHRNRFEENLSSGVVPLTGRSGVSGPNRVNANIRLEKADKELFTIAAGGEKTFGAYTLTFLGQRSENDLSEPNDFWEFRSAAIFGPNAWALNDLNVVDITPDAGTPDRQDPSLFGLRRVRFFDRALEEITWTGKADLRWDIDDSFYLKTGAKYASTDRILDEGRRRFNPGASALTLGTSPAFTDGAFINDTDAGDVPNIFMNIDGLNAFFADPANASFFEADLDDNFVADNAADYALRERIIAGYAMGEKQYGDLELIAGARVEWTDIESSGNLLLNGVATRVEDGGDYVTVTPSIIANYRPDESLVFRAAVTRALGRPDFDIIAPRSTATDDGGPIATVNIGNPDLRPRTSWNFDLSAEWYPNDFTALSVGLFYKDISDELVPFTESLTTQAEMDAALAARGLVGAIDTSVLTRLDLKTTINGASAELKGIELLGQTQFDFLPSPLDGFGASASATFIDGETTLPTGEVLPLVGQAEKTYAFSVFYQKGPIDASVSYAFNDSFLTDPNSNPDLVLDQGAFGRWDAKIAYNVRENVKLFVEGVNLNNEPTTEFQGGRPAWNTEYEYVGTTFFFGASVGF